MKNMLILVGFVLLFILSVTTEPVSDSIDTLAGATNPTFNPQIDDIAGVSEDDD